MSDAALGSVFLNGLQLCFEGHPVPPGSYEKFPNLRKVTRIRNKGRDPAALFSAKTEELRAQENQEARSLLRLPLGAAAVTTCDHLEL